MRELTPAVETEVLAAVKTIAFFVDLEYMNGTVRVWSGRGDRILDGHTYVGVGDLGKIGEVEETTEIRAANLDFVLNGINQSMLAQVLQYARAGKAARMWLAFLDSTDAIIADAVQVYAGRMAEAIIDEGAETSTITQRTENFLVDLYRVNERRYTDQEQQALFAGDLGCEFVPALQDKRLVWSR